MAISQALTWPNFEQTYLASGEPAKVPLLSDPQSELITRAESTQLIMRIRCAREEMPKDIPEFIIVQYVKVSGDTFLDISVEKPNLRRPFFFLALAIRDLLFAGTLSPVAALSRALLENKALLETERILSDETLIGLFGELWFLRELLVHYGSDAVRAWTGPARQSHDFRFGAVEIEVKTTCSTARRHTINGLSQLTASRECALYLLSLQGRSTGPGAGSSLPELVGAIRAKLSNNIDEDARFVNALKDYGYLERDESKYEIRIVLANAPQLIQVNDDFPTLTRSGINSLLGISRSARLIDLQYELDVTGLGIAHGTPEFLQALGFQT